MLVLLMLVGLRAQVCMHPYDGTAVVTGKQTNKRDLDSYSSLQYESCLI
jgi:hypothetical protein